MSKTSNFPKVKMPFFCSPSKCFLNRKKLITCTPTFKGKIHPCIFWYEIMRNIFVEICLIECKKRIWYRYIFHGTYFKLFAIIQDHHRSAMIVTGCVWMSFASRGSLTLCHYIIRAKPHGKNCLSQKITRTSCICKVYLSIQICLKKGGILKACVGPP